MLEQRRHEGRARNVILFVGDGMGIQTHTMARIFKVTRGMLVVLQKVPSETNPKVRNHGEGPY